MALIFAFLATFIVTVIDLSFLHFKINIGHKMTYIWLFISCFCVFLCWGCVLFNLTTLPLSQTLPITLFVSIILSWGISDLIINDVDEAIHYDEAKYTTKSLIGVKGKILSKNDDGSYFGVLDDGFDSNIIINSNDKFENGDKFVICDIDGCKIYALKVIEN